MTERKELDPEDLIPGRWYTHVTQGWSKPKKFDCLSREPYRYARFVGEKRDDDDETGWGGPFREWRPKVGDRVRVCAEPGDYYMRPEWLEPVTDEPAADTATQEEIAKPDYGIGPVTWAARGTEWPVWKPEDLFGLIDHWKSSDMETTAPTPGPATQTEQIRMWIDELTPKENKMLKIPRFITALGVAYTGLSVWQGADWVPAWLGMAEYLSAAGALVIAKHMPAIPLPLPRLRIVRAPKS